MPFVSHKDRKQDRPIFQEEYTPEADFGEVFAAGVGITFDEELSISSALNREGWSDRRKQVQKMIDDGVINREDYIKRTRRGSKFQYDKLAKEFENVKSTAELEEERKALLRSRREYAEDVFSRGSGVARFLGQATGYMLDPLSVATMPISYSTNGARGLAAIGQAAIKAGATEMAVETGIQAFVFDHKHDIDSPYDWQDALSNIATAGAGAALLGGAGVGVREWIGSVRGKAKALPVSEQLDFADETLARVEDTLRDNPLRKEGMTSKELVDADVEFLRQLDERKTQSYKKPVEPVQQLKIDGDTNFTAKEKTVLSKIGQQDDFAQDILRYKQKFNIPEPEKLDLKGKMIDEKVRVKETGEITTVKSDADMVYRRAKKRVDQIAKLRACLNA